MSKDWLVRVVAVALFGVIACEHPVASSTSTSDIVGSWHQSTQLSPAGAYEFSLSFNSKGQFTAAGRMLGIYPGQDSKELSSYTRIEGSYRAEDGRLTMNPQRLTAWDRFFGLNSPERVEEPYRNSGYFDNAQYQLKGDVLTLRYTTYPADAPVPTTMDLVRRD